MKEHEQSFLNVFSNIEVAIYQNQDLIDFINDLIALLFTEKQLYYKNMCKVINAIYHFYSWPHEEDPQ
jgi:hypothetical protein